MAMSRSFGGRLLTILPPIAISPALICSRPAIMRSNVVLPQPEGPTSTTNSPSAIAMSTPCSTSTLPNDFRARRISTAAMHPPSGVSFREVLQVDAVAQRPVAQIGNDGLDRLAPQVGLAGNAVERRVRREDEAAVDPGLATSPGGDDGMVGRRRLLRNDVKRGAAELSGTDRLADRGEVAD